MRVFFFFRDGFFWGYVFGGFFCLLCFSYWWGFFLYFHPFSPFAVFLLWENQHNCNATITCSASAVPGKLSTTIISLVYYKVRPCSLSSTVGKRSSFTGLKRKAVWCLSFDQRMGGGAWLFMSHLEWRWNMYCWEQGTSLKTKKKILFPSVSCSKSACLKTDHPISASVQCDLLLWSWAPFRFSVSCSCILVLSFFFGGLWHWLVKLWYTVPCSQSTNVLWGPP